MGRAKSGRPSDLGANLRHLRAGTGKSLRDIEKRSGLTNGYLSQLERGEVGHPSPTVLRKLASGYDVPFPVVLSWAGYLDDQEVAITPNQAVALSTLGDPTKEELQALKGIMSVLRRNQSATSIALAGFATPLDQVAQIEVAGFARALLLEAEAIGRRPTPLGDLQAAARLVRAGELELSPHDQLELRQRFGRWFDLSLKRVRGALDFRSGSIWLSPELHPKRERFVISHEIGHAILPAHREFFTYVENEASLDPETRWPFEREANFAAAQLLFQCGQLNEEIDSSPISLETICQSADDFGASIVATAREAAEKSRKEIAVAIAYKPRAQYGPTNLFVSNPFEERFHWLGGRGPMPTIREALLASTRSVQRTEWPAIDIRGRGATLRVETMNTGWAGVVLIIRDSAIKRAVKSWL